MDICLSFIYGNCQGFVADDLWILLRDQCGGNTQEKPGQQRDASRHHKDTPDGFMDLADTHGWGLRIFISLADVSLLIRIFY